MESITVRLTIHWTDAEASPQDGPQVTKPVAVNREASSYDQYDHVEQRL